MEGGERRGEVKGEGKLRQGGEERKKVRGEGKRERRGKREMGRNGGIRLGNKLCLQSSSPVT